MSQGRDGSSSGDRPPPDFGPRTRAGRDRTGDARHPAPAGAARDADESRSWDEVVRWEDPPPRPAPEPSSPQFAPLPPPRAGRSARDRPQESTRARERTARGAGARAAAGAGAGAGRTEPRRRDRERTPRRLPLALPAGLLPFLAQPIVAIGVAVVAVLLVGVVGLSALGGGDDPASKEAKAVELAKDKAAKSPFGVPTETELPPATRIVAFTGAPQAKELGILGTMPFADAAAKLKRQAVPYDRKTRPVLRAFDLIAAIANAHPGRDGDFRTRQSGKVIARYLRAARRANGVLILDIQPGGSNFVDETRALTRWLKEPDVELALDPEWRMRPGVQPGTEIGYVSAGEVTATLALVAKIVEENHLPPKLVLVHRFTDGMIKNLDQVKVPKGITPVISVDGVGSAANKRATYARIAPSLPKPWLPGFKLFYTEDAEAGGIMSGKQVMALKPRPHVVLYE